MKVFRAIWDFLKSDKYSRPRDRDDFDSRLVGGSALGRIGSPDVSDFARRQMDALEADEVKHKPEVDQPPGATGWRVRDPDERKKG